MASNDTDISLAYHEQEPEVDPINDIIDYLVRCAKISFKNAHVDENEVRTVDKIKIAQNLYEQSPIEFLMQFGKYLAPYHIGYFENLLDSRPNAELEGCVNQLKAYHSDVSTRKRVRNRRYQAMQKLSKETDYFSDKQTMLRNPLLYEQLVGQYLTDDEIRERDGVDNENLSLLTMILETVDRNHMREVKNEQAVAENIEEEEDNSIEKPPVTKMWGEFDTPDTRPSHKAEIRKQTMISAAERNLLHEEFRQEMYSSFIEGRDEDIDYTSIDNDEQYDDLQQVSQDAEDKYFDSETNEVENLEEHMRLVEEYGKKTYNNSATDDPLDIYMKHMTNKQRN